MPRIAKKIRITKPQARFLAAVDNRGVERRAGQQAEGAHTWKTQVACEIRGWTGTRCSAVFPGMKFYTITEDGKQALQAWRDELAAKKAAAK